MSYFDVYHSKKQVEFILDYNKKHFFSVKRRSDKPCDFIGKVENLEVDFKLLCKHLNIEYQSLPILNKSENANYYSHYSQYYDDETLEIVQNLYEDDIKLLGYGFDDKR